MAYKILADSITGVNGNQLLKGQNYEAGAFIVTHIPDLLEGKFIEEYVEPAPVEAPAIQPPSEKTAKAVAKNSAPAIDAATTETKV